MHFILTCKHEKDRMKTAEKKWRHRFLHYNPVGAFCCHGKQSSDPIWPKTLCTLSPYQMMLQIKFGCDRPTGLRDSRSCLNTHTHTETHIRTDGRTDAGSTGILYAHLRAFGSGELKMHNTCVRGKQLLYPRKVFKTT